jgi:sugar transferase (PEP-CTERM/EpsH1 system associated)
MDDLLFLAHRLPWPADKGDKVRSHNMLRHLAERYRVHVGTFVDDPADAPHVDALRAFAASAHVVTVAPGARRARAALVATQRGESISAAYYRDRRLGRWVIDTVRRHRIAHAYVCSSPMAPYALHHPVIRTVVDLVDVDSEKWRTYAARRPWPLSAVYGREADRLGALEREVVARSAASVVVTEAEAALLRRLAPGYAERIHAIPNGVDAGYFAPDPSRPSPYPPHSVPIVFTGAMDYWPNVDAVCWFARDVLPAIRRERPDAGFHIVGMNPAAAVRALARLPGVHVVGRVPDMRPYLQHARVVVAPLRVARGIQNKVLEAMAMGRPVVATPECAFAVGARNGVELAVADGAGAFVQAALRVMAAATGDAMGAAARAAIVARHGWAPNAARIAALLGDGDSDGDSNGDSNGGQRGFVAAPAREAWPATG